MTISIVHFWQVQKCDPTNEKLYSCSHWCNGRGEPKDVEADFITITENGSKNLIAFVRFLNSCTHSVHLAESQKVKTTYFCKTDWKYGSGPRQVFDLYEPAENHCTNGKITSSLLASCRKPSFPHFFHPSVLFRAAFYSVL